MRIAEIYASIQGEGRLTGTASVFVRASGCNLRCSYCDTPYASWAPEGEDLSTAEIIQQIEACAAGGINHVVITGGEPMLFVDLPQLCAALRSAEQHITIETAGTIYRSVSCDLMSISPKLPNSTPPVEQEPRWGKLHELRRHAPDVIRRLVAEHDYQIKFVIDRLEDCREVESYLAEFPEIELARVWLMPQGVEAEELAAKAAWLEPYCSEHGFHFCPRRQIEWFGATRGT